MKSGFLVFLLSAAITLGATFTWDGSSSTLVSEKSNWTGNKAPSGNPDLVFNTSLISTTNVYFDYSGGATTVADDVTFTPSAGSFTLSSDGGATLKIGNIDNQSTDLQIFDLALEFQNKETVLAGGPVQFNQAISTKTGNNELTFTGNSEIIAGASNIFSAAIELNLDGTTLDLSDTSQSFSSITITGDSIIDFGGSSATISLGSLTVTAGTLTVQNWTGDPGDFAVTDAVDEASIGNISFDGWGDATWDSGDGVTPTPVPEPAHYGAVLTGILLVWKLQRMKRQRKRDDSAGVPAHSV